MITFHISENPIGFPTDPDDTEFKSPRTPPRTNVAIRYEKDGVILRNAVSQVGRRKDLEATFEIENMKLVLEAWLKEKLK